VLATIAWFLSSPFLPFSLFLSLSYRPAGRAVTFAGHGAAGTAILTLALGLAFLAVFALRTQIAASVYQDNH